MTLKQRLHDLLTAPTPEYFDAISDGRARMPTTLAKPVFSGTPVYPLMSIEEIVAFLNSQADRRALENDETSILQIAAEYIKTQNKELLEWDDGAS